MLAHTPGPYFLGAGTDSGTIFARKFAAAPELSMPPNGVVPVCEFDTAGWFPEPQHAENREWLDLETAANGYLFAAAPEMLAMLTRFAKGQTVLCCELTDIINRATGKVQ